MAASGVEIDESRRLLHPSNTLSGYIIGELLKVTVSRAVQWLNIEVASGVEPRRVTVFSPEQVENAEEPTEAQDRLNVSRLTHPENADVPILSAVILSSFSARQLKNAVGPIDTQLLLKSETSRAAHPKKALSPIDVTFFRLTVFRLVQL